MLVRSTWNEDVYKRQVFDNNQCVKEKEQLEDLARQGKLTADVFDNTNAYDSLVDALDVLGISIEDIVNQFLSLIHISHRRCFGKFVCFAKRH